MLFWRREAVGGTGREGEVGAGAVDTGEWEKNEIGHGGGVKSLLCVFVRVRACACVRATSRGEGRIILW